MVQMIKHEYVMVSLAAILLGIVTAIGLFYRPDVVLNVSSVLVGMLAGFALARVIKNLVVNRINRQ
jgi:hypothetical protein